MAEQHRFRGIEDEPDRDQVDFTWLSDWLRRRGLLQRPPKAAQAQQLALFGSAGAPVPLAPPLVARLTQDTEVVADDAVIVRDLRARVIVVVAVAAYVALFSSWTIRHHDGFGTQAFDLGLYDQGVWLLSRFHQPFVTIMGRQLFGDHTSFILLPFVPFYWIWPSAKVLLLSQAFALGAGAVPVFLLAREKLRAELLAAIVAISYLLQPVLGWINLEQFHPDVFEIPLFLFAAWFMVRKRWIGYFVAVGLLLLIKEDVVLLTVPLGLYVAFKYDRKVGALTVVGSVLYAAAAFWWILPALNGVGTLNGWRIPFGGPLGLFRTTATHPGRVVTYATQRPRVWYGWQVLAPLGMLPLLSPSVLFLAIGGFGSNLLSTFYYQYDIHYHYSTLVLAPLMVATVLAIATTAPGMALRRVLVGLLFVTALIGAYLWGPTPLGRHEFVPADPHGAQVTSIRQAIGLIPGDAVLAAYYGWIPHVDHRKEVYMFPTPFKTQYWGTFKQEGQRLPRADRVAYILVPSPLDKEPQAVLDSIRSGFDTIYDQNGVLLLKRHP